MQEESVEFVALDLEGSGAQDRENEAILEIAVVPVVDWEPQASASYCTLVNPERIIPRRPWISPGLTNDVLATAPTLSQIEPRLAEMINGRYVVGHNVGVDWRLLHRRCPTVEPAGLVDTLRLARSSSVGEGNSLTKLLDQLSLTERVNALATGSVPHRALWDTYGVALLLRELVIRKSLDATVLIAAAGTMSSSSSDPRAQPALFD